MVLMLLGYGFFHNAVFPSFLLGHDFMIVCYGPGIAIAVAVVGDRLVDLLSPWEGISVRAAAFAIAMVVCLMTALYASRRLYRQDSELAVTLKLWGEIIQQNTRDSDEVLTCSVEDKVFEYYADRKMVFSIDSPQAFRDSTARSPAALFVCPADQVDKQSSILKYLSGPMIAQTEAGLLLYTPAK